MLVVLGQQVHRAIAVAAVTLVDPLHQPVHPLLEAVVLLELAARGRGHLHEHEPSDPGRVLLEQAFDRIEPLDDALGVVEPVHADGEARIRRQAEPRNDALPAFGHGRPCGDILRVGPLDGDRIALHERFLVPDRDDRVLVLDACLQEPVHRLDEVLAVEPGMEAKDGAAQQPVQDLASPRADAERLRIRPGNVPEHEDGGVGQPLSDHLRQQREVVVLDEDHRIADPCLGNDGVRKALVDRPITLPVRLAEDRPHVRDVAQGPQALVGEAVVVPLLFLGGQPEPTEPVVLLARRHGDAILRVHDFPVGTAAAVRDPGARAGAHDWLHGRHQAAGRPAHDDTAIGGTVVDVGLAVRHHDDLVAAQVRVQQAAQPRSRPGRFGSLRAPVFVFQVAQPALEILDQGLEFRWRCQGPQEALAAEQRPHAGHPALPAELRDDHGDQRNDEPETGNEPDQITTRVLASALDEAQVVQQHEMTQAQGTGAEACRTRSRCGRGGGSRLHGRIGTVIDDLMGADQQGTGGQFHPRLGFPAQRQRAGTGQAQRKTVGSLHEPACPVADPDAEQALVLGRPVEHASQPVAVLVAHALDNRIRQRVRHQRATCRHVAAEPAQRHAIHQRQGDVGGRHHGEHQRQQEPDLEAQRLQHRLRFHSSRRQGARGFRLIRRPPSAD